MIWSIIDRKVDEFRTSRVTAAVAAVMVLCFRRIFVNISLNFIYFIIKYCLYYLNCACKLLRTKLMNLGCLESIFLSASPWSLLYGDHFLVLFVRLCVALLLLLALNRFVYYSDGPDLLRIEKLKNLGHLKLLLPVPLLPVAPNRYLCFVACVVCFVYVYYAVTLFVCFFVNVCCACT